MKKLITIVFALVAIVAQAQEIKLLTPDKKGGKTFMQTLNDRQSSRSFSEKQISLQVLSNMLWAATGINREDGKRTNPTAMNKQEISLYVFNKDGVYLYDHKNHALIKKATGDYREYVANGQDFVKAAPISIVIVGDLSSMPNLAKATNGMTMVAVDGGIVCQNINLFCSSFGLVTVPRATMNKEKIKALLGFDSNKVLLMNNPVGYSK